MSDPLIQQLRERRLALGLSQPQVEKKIKGYSHNNCLHRWEMGHNCPSLFMVECWAEVLGLKLELTGGDDAIDQVGQRQSGWQEYR